MKKTIKQLKEEIELMTTDRDKYYRLYWQLKEEKDKNDRNKMFNLEQEKAIILGENRNLLEIIRWLIKPKTAEFPFREKTLKHEKNYL